MLNAGKMSRSRGSVSQMYIDVYTRLMLISSKVSVSTANLGEKGYIRHKSYLTSFLVQ